MKSNFSDATRVWQLAPSIKIKAASEVRDKTTAINQLWQTDFTYLEVLGWGWFKLSTILDDYQSLPEFREPKPAFGRFEQRSAQLRFMGGSGNGESHCDACAWLWLGLGFRHSSALFFRGISPAQQWHSLSTRGQSTPSPSAKYSFPFPSLPRSTRHFCRSLRPRLWPGVSLLLLLQVDNL
ncbi:hypothetical protein [Tateyamaria sp.]|uniref:hypothetical protein n=1 Tax=Tateyamaria sp. TaxID=1929288 RepID=UPI00329DB269